MNPRLAAVKSLLLVIDQGRNLPDALSQAGKSDNPALTQAMCYGVVRHYHRLIFFSSKLINKPLRKKDQDIQLLILLGMYQLETMSIPDHAAVSESVKICKALKKDWSRNLVNGVLRQFQRQKEHLEKLLEKNAEAKFSHPQWMLSLLQADWPDNWQTIATANNQHPPMTLRINRQKTSAEEYMKLLKVSGLKCCTNPYAPDALTLEKSCDVFQLPGFEKGMCSVQDASAQLAALLLDAQAGDTVLDACAAPGGKTAYILESQPTLKKLVALDIEERRLNGIYENLSRLGLTAEVIRGDASQPDKWWDGETFNRILLDAPCSATGVIRRHPDIKLLRRTEDIAQLVKLQQQILNQLWPLLKPGGILVYATCSVLKQENTQQIEKFLALQPDARLDEIKANWGIDTAAGRQILPGVKQPDKQGMDGFFYAKLYKQP